MIQNSAQLVTGIRNFLTTFAFGQVNMGEGLKGSISGSSLISAIMPVYNGARLLEKTVTPLLGMINRGELLEVIIVDDFSNDDSASVAECLGARLLRTGKRLGPGAARNLAAEHAAGEILWFIDADVIVHDDAAAQIVNSFSDPTVAAVFGSYDDRPFAPNFLSQYKNLVHHYYHQRGKREASTFWAGCGAVRRPQFLAVGGFNAQRFTRPSIEDIELGYRLRAMGQRVLLNPLLQGTHLKKWTFLNLMYTEVICRAIPWSRLLLNDTGIINDLNVSFSERVRAALACCFVVVFMMAVFGLVVWWVPLLVFLSLILGNWELAGFFLRRKNILFTVGAILFQQLYYVYSVAAYTWAWLEYQVVKWFRLL